MFVCEITFVILLFHWMWIV